MMTVGDISQKLAILTELELASFTRRVEIMRACDEVEAIEWRQKWSRLEESYSMAASVSVVRSGRVCMQGKKWVVKTVVFKSKE
jgi:hypothetical protein